MKNTTIGFYDLQSEVGTELNSKEAFKSAVKLGYKYYFRWVNSDDSWMYFTKTFAQANKAASELYMKEKKEKNRKFAEQYYSEHIDVDSIENYIENLD